MAFFNGWGIQDWIAVGSALVALVSVAFNFRLVARQERREVEALRLQKDADLISWADGAIDVLADIQRLLRDRDRLIDAQTFAVERSRLRTALSAVMDRGRLFFPGQSESTEDLETAYAGDMDPVIQALDDAQRILKDLDLETHAYRREDVLALVDVRRRFVSRVFDAVDPRRRAQVFRSLGSLKA